MGNDTFQTCKNIDFKMFLQKIWWDEVKFLSKKKFFRFFSVKILRNSYFCIKILLLYIAVFL